MYLWEMVCDTESLLAVLTITNAYGNSVPAIVIHTLILF